MASHKTHEKPFGPLLESCAQLVRVAYEDRNRSLSQAAVLQSCLLIEAAANCCLLSLRLPRSLLDELDRLPALTKCETFLLIKKRGPATLDRSCPYYRGARELKRLRDLAVHPKTTGIEWKPDKRSFSGKAAATDFLRITKDPSSWTGEDAVVAFRTANAFLDNFLRERCKLSARSIRLLLLAPEDDEITDCWITNDSLTWAARQKKVPLRYAGVW
jgi:hypothetical protein